MLSWEDLPLAARSAVETRFGQVLGTQRPASGAMPGLAAIVTTTTQRVFLKAISQDSPLVKLYARERTANAAISRAAVPAPRLLWCASAAGWDLTTFEYVAGRQPDLSPGSPDLPAVLDAIAQINAARVPGLPSASFNLRPMRSAAAQLLDDIQPTTHWPTYLLAAALDAMPVDAVTGDALVHHDLHPQNLIITNDGVVAIDWTFAASGTQWADLALLAPRLVIAVHAPESADATLSVLPAWRSASSSSVDGFIALWTAFRLFKGSHCGLPAQPSPPRLGPGWHPMARLPSRLEAINPRDTKSQ